MRVPETFHAGDEGFRASRFVDDFNKVRNARRHNYRDVREFLESGAPATTPVCAVSEEVFIGVPVPGILGILPT